MITLITGLPGASKTLNTLRLVSQECEGRAIYYYGIDDLKLPWTQLTLEELHAWFDLPAGSVIVVDEAQRVWPARPTSRSVPESVARLDKHRHGGYDFYVITQRPPNVDAQLRGLSSRHLHYERVFSRNGAKQVEFQQAETDPRCSKARGAAQITYVPFKKEYFDYYKSAEVHTYKPRVPRAVWFLLCAVLLVAVCGYRLMSGFQRPDKPVPEVVQGESAIASEAFPAADTGPVVLSADEYIALREPRIADIPWSAPIYDALTEPKSYPRPQCLYKHRTHECECFTQQGTSLAISSAVCMRIVDEGYFDPALPDRPEREQRPERAERVAALAPADTRAPKERHRVVVLENTRTFENAYE